MSHTFINKTIIYNFGTFSDPFDATQSIKSNTTWQVDKEACRKGFVFHLGKGPFPRWTTKPFQQASLSTCHVGLDLILWVAVLFNLVEAFVKYYLPSLLVLALASKSSLGALPWSGLHLVVLSCFTVCLGFSHRTVEEWKSYRN